MFYIQDLGAHELHGPFTSKTKAYAYALWAWIKSYRIVTDTEAQNMHDPGSLRLVPREYR